MILTGAAIMYQGEPLKIKRAPGLGLQSTWVDTEKGKLTVFSNAASIDLDQVSIEVKNDTIWIF